MKSEGLPTASTIPVLEPIAEVKPVATRMVKFVADAIRTRAPRLAEAIRAKSSAIVRPTPNWKWTVMNFQRCSREMKFEWLKDLDRAACWRAQRGEDMHRLTHDAKMQRRPRLEELAAALAQGQKEWAKRSWVERLFPEVPWNVEPRAGEAMPRGPYVTTQEILEAEKVFADLESRMGDGPAEPDSQVNTVADKDANVIWGMRASFLLARWATMLMSQGRWRIDQFSVSTIISYYRGICNQILPRSLLPLVNNFHVENIPYVYPSVKVCSVYEFACVFVDISIHTYAWCSTAVYTCLGKSIHSRFRHARPKVALLEVAWQNSRSHLLIS